MKPNLFKGARTFLNKNSAQIFFWTGIVTGGVAIYHAVKATPKALEKIEEKKAELGVDKLTVVDTVKSTWKCYLPAGAAAASSVACLISSNSINTKRTAALGAAYNITKLALEEYKDAVVETVGESAAKEVRTRVAEKRMEKIPEEVHKEVKTVIVTGDNDIACYDSLSGRVFMSNIDKIDKAVNDLNRMIIEDMYASLNEFYNIIGLNDIQLGEVLGWHIDDGKIEVEYDSILIDKKPCLSLIYNVAPSYDYYKICR